MTETRRILERLHRDPNSMMTLSQFVEAEIKEFTSSSLYSIMVEADEYYRNRSAVQNKKNEYKNRSNTKIEHPILKKLIDQKINYTLSRPFSINSINSDYGTALNKIFDDSVRQKVKRFGRGAPRMGKGCMLFYFDDKGNISFRVVNATQVIPFWCDDEHTMLEGFIYFYNVIEYTGTTPHSVTKAELWDDTGVEYFSGKNGKFVVDEDKPEKHCHFIVNGKGYNWKTPPIIWCKYNDEELPLQYFLKDLIDDINFQTSFTADVLRDVAKFIWVLKNYAGEDLNQFVTELRESLAIKVEADGGVDTIQPDVKVQSVLDFIDKQRRDTVDLGAGVDTKDPELGSASGKAIYFRYMDLDTDSANIQSEMAAAFKRLKPFLDDYLLLIGEGDFYDDEFTVTFNTDMPVDEKEIFDNAVKAKNIGLSTYTILQNIPWVKDVDEELELIAKEQAQRRKVEEQEIANMAALNFPEQAPDKQEVPIVEGGGNE